VCGAIALRGELDSWAQHTPAGAAIAALFRSVPMPGGATPILRPPAEARRALDALIAGAPRDAMLYRLRAHEAEMALDFAAAETDWKAYAERASDTYAAQWELADFYHRRLQPRDEIAALMSASQAQDDPLEPATAQRGWRAFERMAALAGAEALPDAVAEPVFRAWVARYPKEPAAWRKLIDHLTGRQRLAVAEIEIAAYGRALHDQYEPVRMRAALAERRGDTDAALAVYDRALQPLWPPEMLSAYFKLLEERGRLREFAGRARTALASNPANLDATVRLFHYFRAASNIPAARRALLEYRFAKESSRQAWTAAELETLAQLFARLPDAGEAARLYYALYSVAPANGPHRERALSGLANLLLSGPEQPILFGSGDLSFYKDIATVDSSPGFLNGILSLTLNWTGIRSEYEMQNSRSAPYFHRAAAAGLVTLLDRQFPRSVHRDGLHAALVAAYGAYGDDASAIRAGREYLTTFPNGSARVAVALQVSDALARANRTSEEFALYEQLLRQLAAKASGVPIGAPRPAPQPPAAENPEPSEPNPNPNPTGARSADYVRVLDKYLSRLAVLRRPLDALRVYRAEIDRNPNDPGLYARLAAFLEPNGMSRDVEDTYTRAIAKFPDPSWRDKLARWYLRTKQFAALEKVTRDAIAVFSGSELEHYFGEIVSNHPDAAMYLQLNLYAHQLFPEDLVFVGNLLVAYERRETRDAAAAERLLREYWFYDPQLRVRLFERLAQQGRLSAELAQIRAANPALAQGQFDRAVASNPAAVQFAVEAEAWLSHFEAAAPAARALAAAYPGRKEFAAKASSLYRSLAAYDKRDTDVALTMAGYEQRADPGDAAILARMGDICADRELFARAATFWERMPAAQPGNPEAYLDTATVYWDYYRYDDALRWIGAARRKFADPALFAYQAGAIYEGKRDYTAAVREYTAVALAGEPDAHRRLLRLVQRAQTRPLVDRATAAAVDGVPHGETSPGAARARLGSAAGGPPPSSNPSGAAVTLRIAVLEALDRRQDLDALLHARVESARTAAELTALEETARRLGFDAIEERANQRLAAVTNDPVDKMRLTLANVRLLESKQDVAGAARVVDALYRDHPLILGVVRGAVDFHVRNRQPAEAEDALLEAARRARADLAAQFTLEAARIATDAGQFPRARTLLAGLLAADPLRADYLSAMADTYLRAKDDAGFRDYQLAAIERLKQSPLAPAERPALIASLRRSLIPALGRMNDHAAAVDQYIEILNRYPEDEALAKEAAAYAMAHGQTARLLAFYRKTANDAPLDYRWPIVLGRIETVMEDYPAAIADYERGVKARPDRADVLQAKAGLEERIMRFGDAIQSYARLYELAYRDPQWLIKVAELRARTGQNAEAVSALKTAIIGARTETAEADFEIAGRLDEWHTLPDAVGFAERGANLAGADLFKGYSNAATYARIMAQARRMDAVLSRWGTDPAVNPQVAQVVGRVISETYTPEEKARLEQELNAQAARLGRQARDATLLPLVAAAGMVEVESRWRYESMGVQPVETRQVDPRLAALQIERGLYGQFGRQMEAYAAANAGRSVEAVALVHAAQAFIAEGDREGETRTLRAALARNALSGPLLDRYLSGLAARQPDELLAIVRSNPSAQVRDRAVQLAIAGDRRDLAYAAVRARGSVLPPVWTNALTALTGLYFDDHSAPTDNAFQAALDTRTIGDRLKAPLKPDSAIVGSVWFYYGARYGDFLAAGKSAAADTWLPASLEAAPGNPEAYVELGDSYAEAKQSAKAIAQYQLALELDADRGDAEDRIARVLWPENQTEALPHWRAALKIFESIQGRGIRVPDSFWNRVAAAITAMGERHALEPMRADIAHLIEDYYQRNAEYRLHELIQPAVQASIASGVSADWLIELGRSMNQPEMMLGTLRVARNWSPEQLIALQREIVAAWAKKAEGQFGDAREAAVNEAAGQRVRLISMLLNAGDVKEASAEWAQLPPARAPRHYWERDMLREMLEIDLAAKTGTLAALLERFRAHPESAPGENSLRQEAQALQRAGDEESARAVLEFLYDREIRDGHLTAANFLGLAEVKLERNDTAAAMALANRMALVVEDGFETLLPAADLFGKYGKSAESAEFLRRRIKAAPWDAEARLRLARALPAASAERGPLAASVTADSLALYELRAQAARMAAPAPSPSGPAPSPAALAPSLAAPGTELALLAAAHVSPEAASQPYQVEARMDAAHASGDAEVQLRLWREALAIVPSSQRVRLGALRAAIALRRDSLSLALDQGRGQPQFGGPYMPYRMPYRGGQGVPRQPQAELGDAEQAAIYESLAAAAERLDDLAAAQNYLRQALGLRSGEPRAQLQRKIDALAAEQARRNRNAARQPVIREQFEQGRVVGPRVPGSQP